MGRSRTHRSLVTVVQLDGAEQTARRRPDQLLVEEPLAIQLDGVRVTTTMRTPGHDFELAVGFCLTEGLLGEAAVRQVRYCVPPGTPQRYNTVSVDTDGVGPTPVPRLTTTTSSCGWCGADELDQMAARLAPLDRVADVAIDVLAGVPERVTPHQELFAATGAAHAAAAFALATGEVSVVREDVGRHNAVDKVIGALVLTGALPARRPEAPALGLFVSSRASVEIVQKAWAAGFRALVSVSAPTALAVEAARRANLVLAGFLRAGRINVYAPERPGTEPA